MFFCQVLIVIAAFNHLSEAAKYGEISKREYYFKAPGTLPSAIRDTLISSTFYHDSRVSLKYVCFQKCSMEPDCSLVCIKDNTCTTYYALLSVYWLSSNYLGSVEVFTEICYSNWKFPHDITSKIIAVSSSSAYPGDFHAGNSIDGFYSSMNNYLFHSILEFHAWARFDFDEIVKITKIIVKTRHDNAMETHFVNIQVSIGNTTASYSPVGQCCSTMAPSGDFVVFSMCEPKYAKYILIQNNSPSNVYLVLADVKVIG